MSNHQKPTRYVDVVSQIIHITLLINTHTLDDLQIKALRVFSSKTYGHLKNQMTLNSENIAQVFFLFLLGRHNIFVDRCTNT